MFLLLLAGCGQDEPRLAPVRGKVYYQNTPLRGGTIVFTPDPDRGGRGPLARAQIQTDGSYTLSTGTEAGAVIGWHRVTVLAVEPESAGPQAAGRPRAPLPRKYSDPELSGLAREVKPGIDNVIDLRLD